MSGEGVVEAPDGFTLLTEEKKLVDGHACVRIEFVSVDALHANGLTYAEAVRAVAWAAGVTARALSQVNGRDLDDLRFEHRCARTARHRDTGCGVYVDDLQDVAFTDPWEAEVYVPPGRAGEVARVVVRALAHAVEVDTEVLRYAVEEDAGRPPAA